MLSCTFEHSLSWPHTYVYLSVVLLYKEICLCFIYVHLSTCLFCMFLWFLGHWRILVTRRTSQIYSRRPAQQPASNSQGMPSVRSPGHSEGWSWGGSRDGGSPVSWVVEKRVREIGGGGSKDRRGVLVVLVGRGAEGIWFGASRASSLACCIPGDQHHSVSFHPHPPPWSSPQSLHQFFVTTRQSNQ